VISNVTFACEEMMKALFDHEGLMASLDAVVGKEGGEWKVAKEKAPGAIKKFA